MSPLNSKPQNKPGTQPAPSTEATSAPDPTPVPNERSLFRILILIFLLSVHLINFPLIFIMTTIYQIRWFVWLDCSIEAFSAHGDEIYAHQIEFANKIRPITLIASLLMLNEVIWHPIARIIAMANS